MLAAKLRPETGGPRWFANCGEEQQMLSKGLLVMIQKELIFILFKHPSLDKFNKLSLPEGLFEDRHLPRTNTKNQ